MTYIVTYSYTRPTKTPLLWHSLVTYFYTRPMIPRFYDICSDIPFYKTHDTPAIVTYRKQIQEPLVTYQYRISYTDVTLMVPGTVLKYFVLQAHHTANENLAPHQKRTTNSRRRRRWVNRGGDASDILLTVQRPRKRACLDPARDSILI
jgi:hypothetical protein